MPKKQSLYITKKVIYSLFFLFLSLSPGCSLMHQLGIGGEDHYYSDRGHLAPQPMSDEVTLGMNMEGVRKAWGDPRAVQVAGTADQGNQRWIYPQSSTQSWNSGPMRIIYFENGRVAGWESAPAP